ncbi:Uncharacterised protein [Kluyvera ascorbata]|nr:hypothetical protein KATP_28470 [Kluyvera ascorbata]STX00286.1 Uncharacterised protein [Kluyvera ascorbata]
MITYLHYPRGTLVIAPDGSQSGYEPTRQDIPNTVHLRLPAPYYIDIFIDSYCTVLRHKYIHVNHTLQYARLGTKRYPINYAGYEANTIQYLNALGDELELCGSLLGEHIPYRVSIFMQ